jgi:hypothetical protein
MKETIKTIADRIRFLYPIMIEESLTKILTEELSTLNPMRIDEERMRECFEQVFTKDIYAKSNFKTIVDKYNSTLADHQVLQPLPSEMPKEFKSLFGTLDKAIQIWRWFTKHYGTPTKKELPSVEELDEEICALHRVIMPATSKLIAQHLVNKYSLPSKKEEWWMNLKEGERFVNGNKIMESDGCIYLFGRGEGVSDVNDCSPYTEPSAREKLKAKGVTDDEINELINQHEKQEFMKEVKGC